MNIARAFVPILAVLAIVFFTVSFYASGWWSGFFFGWCTIAIIELLWYSAVSIKMWHDSRSNDV